MTKNLFIKFYCGSIFEKFYKSKIIDFKESNTNIFDKLHKLSLIFEGIDFDRYGIFKYKYSTNIFEIELKNCKKLQMFPVEKFKKNLKTLKVENCSIGSLVPPND